MNKTFALLATLVAIAGLVPLAGAAAAMDRATPWARHVIDDSSQGADGVKLLDVNGDGLMDLTTGWEQGGVSRVYINPGPSSVKDPWPAVTAGPVGDVEDAVFVDLDGDGALDVVSSAEGVTKGVFVHWAPANPADYLDPTKWQTAPLPASLGLRWMFAEPMQVDGVRGVDIVAGGKDAGAKVGWFESPADPRDLSAWQFHAMSGVGWTMSLILSDMDGDGDTDVVVTDRYNNVGLQGARWLENPGTGDPAQRDPWPNHFIGAQGTQAMLSAMVDLDRDGLEDLLVPSLSATVNELLFLRRLDASGDRWQASPIQAPPDVGTVKATNAGDIDGDGDLDVVLSFAHADGDLSGVVWMAYENSPTDPVWVDYEISGPVGIKYDIVQLLDLDADGDLDVITTEEKEGGPGLGVIWYENPSNPARSPAGFYRAGWNLTSVPVVPANPEASFVLRGLGQPLDYALFRYDAGVGYFVYPSSFGDVSRGRGYWLYLAADPGAVASVAGEAAAGPVALALARGWNLIGYPFASPQPLSNCQVTRGAETRSLGEAVSLGWVSGTLYWWDPQAGYRLVSATGYGHDSYLRPWYGYWIYSSQPDAILVIPAPAS
jgi:hypothetical protein